MLDAVRLRQLLSYDPTTGAFYWAQPVRGTYVGKLAGTGPILGSYQRVRVDGKEFKAHRLAWLHVTGEWPDGEIDHINGEPSDNRFANLRLVTHQQNMANCRNRMRGNKRGTGQIGRSYRAYVAGEHLGCFATQEEAQRAYAAAASERFGSFDWQKSEGLQIVPGQQRAPRTHCARGHELSGENISNGIARIRCRRCRADDQARRRSSAALLEHKA